MGIPNIGSGTHFDITVKECLTAISAILEIRMLILSAGLTRVKRNCSFQPVPLTRPFQPRSTQPVQRRDSGSYKQRISAPTSMVRCITKSVCYQKM